MEGRPNIAIEAAASAAHAFFQRENGRNSGSWGVKPPEVQDRWRRLVVTVIGAYEAECGKTIERSPK